MLQPRLAHGAIATNRKTELDVWELLTKQLQAAAACQPATSTWMHHIRYHDWPTQAARHIAVASCVHVHTMMPYSSSARLQDQKQTHQHFRDNNHLINAA